MRQLLLSFLLMLLISFAQAQAKSNLTISTTGNTYLKINFNLKAYSLQDRSTTFQSLEPGNYPIIIYQLQYKNSIREYIKVYEGPIKLNAGKHLEMTVLRFGKTSWDEGDIEPDNWQTAINNPTPIGVETTSNVDSRIITPEKYALVFNALKNEYNESKKTDLAKAIFKNNMFSLNQVKEMSKQFYNDALKINFLKYSYDFCVDKDVYFSLSDQFYNLIIKKDFMDFLAGK